jgi:hypothetical protein
MASNVEIKHSRAFPNLHFGADPKELMTSSRIKTGIIGLPDS